MKKTFHSSTDDQQDTENAKGTTVIAISVGRLSHSKLNPEPYPLLLAQAVQLWDVFYYYVSQQC